MSRSRSGAGAFFRACAGSSGARGRAAAASRGAEGAGVHEDDDEDGVVEQDHVPPRGEVPEAVAVRVEAVERGEQDIGGAPVRQLERAAWARKRNATAEQEKSSTAARVLAVAMAVVVLGEAGGRALSLPAHYRRGTRARQQDVHRLAPQNPSPCPAHAPTVPRPPYRVLTGSGEHAAVRPSPLPLMLRAAFGPPAHPMVRC